MNITDKKKLSIHELNEEKGKLSRLIGEAKAAGTDTGLLIQQMKEVSQALKLLTASQKKKTSPNQDQQSTLKPASKRPQYLDSHSDEVSQAFDLTKLKIRTVTDQDKSAWNHYVDNHSYSCSYHRYEFKQLIENSFNHNCPYLLAEDNGKPVGILPLVELNSKLFGHILCSIPYFNYAGPIANHIDIENALIKKAADLSDQNNCQHIELRDTKSRPAMPSKEEKVTMILPLPATKDALWKQFGSKVRAQVKKSDEHTPSIRFGKHELLDDFYSVFSRNMRDLGTPVYGKYFFDNFLSLPDINSTLAVAYINDLPVACGFLLEHASSSGNSLEIPWASTIRAWNKTNINMFMYWKVLEFAVDNGYQFFDFGRSSQDAPTYKFKKQWGTIAHQLYWHYQLEANQHLPQINPQNPKYKLQIALWKTLPLWVANFIGPKIIKHIA